MRLIDADKILDALNIFGDKENGNKHFLYGIETAKELIEDTLEEQEGMQTKTEYLEAIDRAIEGAKARFVTAAVERLQAYQSTGLSPTEVKSLVAEVERLRQMFEPVCPKCGLANCRGIWKHTCDRCGADMREKTKHEN